MAPIAVMIRRLHAARFLVYHERLGFDHASALLNGWLQSLVVTWQRSASRRLPRDLAGYVFRTVGGVCERHRDPAGIKANANSCGKCWAGC